MATDDTAQIQASIDAGDFELARRDTPYVITASLNVPSGRTIRFAPGVQLEWQGPTDAFVGVFRIVNVTGVALVCSAAGAEFIVQCANPSPNVRAVFGGTCSDVRLAGLLARNCLRSHFSTATATPYGSVITAQMKADDPSITGAVNGSSRIVVTGGGCEFDASTGSEAGDRFEYSSQWEARDSRYSNIGNGIIWWGGNAGDDGSASAVRKTSDGVIHNCRATTIGAGGIWGSMGLNIRVSDSFVRGCGDVGFDAEGSQQVTFAACHAEECTNGTFSVFYLSRGIVFEGCTSIQRTDGRRHLLVSTSDQNSRDVTWVGGRFETFNGLGVTGAAPGALLSFTMKSAMLVNVAIACTGNNNGKVDVSDNVLLFDQVAPRAFVAIDIAGIHGGFPLIPSATVVNNRINSAVSQPSGSIAISVHDDNNGDFNADVHANKCLMVTGGFPMAGIVLHWAGQNAGSNGVFNAFGNTGMDSIQTSTAGAASVAVFNLANNFNRTGAAVSAS